MNMDADQRIAKQVEAALNRERRVNVADSELAIACRNGTVTLRGKVPSVSAKRLSVRLAKEVSGVESVEDELLVRVGSPLGDLELAEHVRNALIQERNIEEKRIEIETDPEGVVTLRGSVHSLVQVRLCEVLCWWIPGTSNVRNRLLVEPPEEDSDAELKDNLSVILEKDVLVNPKKFIIRVSGGRVTLQGTVDSATERDAAEKDCWYTPGVIDVVNELSVR